MKLENLKQDLPETPEFIHQMVAAEVNRQVNQEKIAPMRKAKRNHWSFGRTVAAAACAALVLSTTVYAGVSLYHLRSEKNGTYGMKTTVATENDQSITLPEEVPEVKLTANYIPEGMAWTEDGKLNYEDQAEGFSFITLLLDQSDIQSAIDDLNVVDSETRTFGKYEGTYIRLNDLEASESSCYNQRFYLLCPEEYRVIVAYVSSTVSKEEAYKVMENLELTETGEMVQTQGEYSRWSNFVNPEVDTSAGEEITSQPVEDVTVHQVGEAMAVSTIAENADGEFVDSPSITASVDKVQVADDLSLLDKTQIPEEWLAAVGSDGKLEQNELSYIKSGDGVDSLDEIVSTEMENQKLVAVDVTYTNTGKEKLKNLLYCTAATTIKQEAGKYTMYDFEEQPGDGYDYVSGKSVASLYEMGYFDVRETSENGNNYISSLAPGESVTVRMAWIVNERDLSDLYIDLSPSGNGRVFNEKTCLVDITTK